MRQLVCVVLFIGAAACADEPPEQAGTSSDRLVASENSPLNYTQWRGENRDGAASAFVEPESWPDDLKSQWKVEVGEGYATPLVVGTTVYSFTRRDGQEVMAALAVATGSELWQTGYAAPYTPSDPSARHGAGPKACSVMASFSPLASAASLPPSMPSTVSFFGAQMPQQSIRFSVPPHHRSAMKTPFMLILETTTP